MGTFTNVGYTHTYTRTKRARKTAAATGTVHHTIHQTKGMFYFTHSSMTRFRNALPTLVLRTFIYNERTHTHSPIAIQYTYKHRFQFLFIQFILNSYTFVYAFFTSHVRMCVCSCFFLSDRRCLLFTFCAFFSCCCCCCCMNTNLNVTLA